MNNNVSNKPLLDFESNIWEAELDIVLPKNQANIIVSQQAIQRQITLHKIVDKRSGWENVRIQLPKVRNARAGSQPVKNSLISPKVTGFDFVFFCGYYSKKILLICISLLGLVLKVILFLILTILGDKKALKKRRPKSRIIRKRKPRRNQNIKKVSARTNKALQVSQGPHNGNWKPVSTNFVPSSNLYCYWCAKKLGFKSWESNGRYYCEGCYTLKK